VALAAAVGQPDKYAGELPVCYVALKPGMQATADELKTYAEPLIAERPAWPKQIIVIDAIPVTSVGKIFKPQLRTDAVQRLVAQVVADAVGSNDAVIEVAAGGKRGIDVTVTLPAALSGQQGAVEKVLDGYLFDYKVQCAN
jgi:fatty-acyl-CoA synthase